MNNHYSRAADLQGLFMRDSAMFGSGQSHQRYDRGPGELQCAVKQEPGHDIVREYVEAARAEGLRVGFYYSLMDWHHPDGAKCATDEETRKRFVAYTHRLIRELLTNYGKIDGCGATSRGRWM